MADGYGEDGDDMGSDPNYWCLGHILGYPNDSYDGGCPISLGCEYCRDHTPYYCPRPGSAGPGRCKYCISEDDEESEEEEEFKETIRKPYE